MHPVLSDHELSVPTLRPGAALFLDFDGCLVGIAPRPDAVVVPPEMPMRLATLYDRLDGAVALISGRDVADLRSWLPDFPGVIAGSHGAEIDWGGGAIEITHKVDLDARILHEKAVAAVADFANILVEAKPHGVALHYRSDPSLRGVVEDVMQRLASEHPEMVLQPAKMAVELRPAGTGKDSALDRLMAVSPFAGRTPVYVGDDLTDEVAMARAAALNGYGIKIGGGETIATYRLDDPAALAGWLDDMLAGLR